MGCLLIAAAADDDDDESVTAWRWSVAVFLAYAQSEGRLSRLTR